MRVGLLILKRLGAALLTLWLVSLLVFILSSMLPGDAASEMLGQSATPEAVAALRLKLGLDQPLYVRYFQWLFGLVSGHPGQSMISGLPVAEIIGTRLPKSLFLAGLTALVSVPVSLTIGIVSAIYRNSFIDRALNVMTLSMVAVPEFLVATLSVLVFAVSLRWLPALTIIPDVADPASIARAYALPVMTLCFVVVAQMARMTRAAVADQLDQPYVEMAVLKGLTKPRVILRHVLPNATGPIVNAVALSLSYLLGGVVIVETVFNYPGVASLIVDAVTSRDMPLLLACTMVFCTAYMVLVLIADVAAILANPRLARS
ncbi:ABC transporter permease [Asticcacaulis endophyticus]|uniref:ABC transporter permease n=1 Tax=Asticcacaulis endophyticus TaxID=1395890 RepID=A0A918US16_9CAUL|nr:ABC transporter permease [Asticcacaulis endophyticus]GGZ31110.1 ABC transporter permease [Asticcacaulis endophyticus]